MFGGLNNSARAWTDVEAISTQNQHRPTHVQSPRSKCSCEQESGGACVAQVI